MRSYKPSKHVSLAGVLLMAGAALLGSLAIGALVAYSSREFYGPLIEPILVGFALLVLVGGAARIGRSPDRLAAGLIGLLAGVLVYGVYHYGAYWLDRRESIEMITQDLGTTYGEVDDAVVARLFDEWLLDETGRSGFLGYLLMTAESGVSFTVSTMYGSSLRPWAVRGIWVWGYWATELALVVLFSGGGSAVLASNRPFCDKCRDWFGSPRLVTYVNNIRQKAFADHISNGAMVKAAEETTCQHRIRPADFAVLARACPRCKEGDAVLSMHHINMQLQADSTGMATHRVPAWFVTAAELRSLVQAVKAVRQRAQEVGAKPSTIPPWFEQRRPDKQGGPGQGGSA